MAYRWKEQILRRMSTRELFSPHHGLRAPSGMVASSKGVTDTFKSRESSKTQYEAGGTTATVRYGQYSGPFGRGTRWTACFRDGKGDVKPLEGQIAHADGRWYGKAVMISTMKVFVCGISHFLGNGSLAVFTTGVSGSAHWRLVHLKH
jgi:hypothetical protein